MKGSRREVLKRLAVAPWVIGSASAVLASAGPGWASSAPFLADRIVVVKSERRLYLMQDGEIARSFNVALGRVPRGHKVYEGDGRTPEGVYYLDARNEQSRFHRSLRISYPNVDDRRRAYALGRNPGGQIMIHGVPEELIHWGPDHSLFNWTEGCIAVTNTEIEMIWDSVELGVPVEILP